MKRVKYDFSLETFYRSFFKWFLVLLYKNYVDISNKNLNSNQFHILKATQHIHWGPDKTSRLK